MAHAKNLKSEKNLKTEVKVNGFASKNNSKGRGKKRQNLGSSPVSAPSPKKLKVELPLQHFKGGVVLTVGTGDIGQLGLGPDVEEKTRPCMIADLKDVIQVCAGGLHSLCLTNDGKVYSWGCNDEGGLGRITSTEEENFSVLPVELPAAAVQISAGDCHSAALLVDGSIFAWGSYRDNSGPLGFLERDTIQKLPRQILEGFQFSKISSGHNHLALLTINGNIYTCGCGESGQLGRIAEVFATRNNRNRNGTDNLLEPHPLKVYKSRKLILFDDVWAGGCHTFAKASQTGDIYGFGLNNFCQLGDEDTNMKFQPVLLNAFRGKQWKEISAGKHHSLAVDEDGAVYSMGRNEYGRLGLGEGIDAHVPTPIPSLINKKASHISAGECISFVTLENGEAYGFGMGSNNQLAQGDEEDRLEPTLLKGKQLEEKKVISVVAGGQHSIILAVPK